MKDNSKVIIALLSGLAAGGLLGVLLAPDKGSETWNRLTLQAKTLGYELKHKANDDVIALDKKTPRHLKSKAKRISSGL